MGSSELEEWKRYWLTQPWGSYRDNLHTGILASLIVNIMRRKGTRAVTFDDFMLVDRSTHRVKKTEQFLGWLHTVGKKKKDTRGK